METFAAAQVRDYTEAERAAVDGAMARIENLCAGRGYALPATDGVVFIKTTMAEENDAGGYTHGTQIYLGEILMEYALSDDPDEQAFFDEILAHELFHCLTRNHPDFRAKMYAILGFTVVGEDYDFPLEIREMPIVREADGLAKSSRNVYLKPAERKAALVLSKSLFAAQKAFEAGERSTQKLTDGTRAMIAAEPMSDIDYVEMHALPELTPAHGTVDCPHLLAVAVRFGTTRLIDNVILDPSK